MAYFHHWTLRAADSEEHAPCAGQLRKSEECWQDALCRWLDGNILCEEARRYVGNFLSVHRVRPADEGSDVGNSDDVISDEELVLSSEALADALRTRIGGRGGKADAQELDAEDAGKGHYANSLAAVQARQETWGSGHTSQEPTVPKFNVPGLSGQCLGQCTSFTEAGGV